MRTIIAFVLATACIAPVCGTAPGPAADDPVLAIVQDVEIRQSDVDRLYEQVGATPEEVPVDRAIDELIRRQSIRQYVIASGVQIDQAQIDKTWQAALDNLKQADMTLEQYAEQMKMTVDELKEIHTIDQKLRKLVESKVTDAERAQLEDYVRASHILLALGEDASDEQVQEAEAKIAFIKQEIEGGQPFEEAAKAYSDCPSSENGGDLDYFPRFGAMAEPFAAAAYAQEKDKVGNPVKTEFGIHIIKVTDRRKATETEKQQAYSMLLQVKFADLMADVEKTVKVERLFKQDEEETPASDDEDSSAKDAG